ncbi:hypothetical protein [Streptomyces griseorubiginosus]|uniref:hypothetical protein n=1 Tax=Streptomyces griseorubiginosus TaxID=67304 RepID=UPI001FCB3B2E|nr:hypothetical protein [Streptomyces griseorubiginosus]
MLDGLIKPVIEVCDHYGTVPWQLTPRVMRRFSATVEPAIDPFNRSRHRGDFGPCIPPSRYAVACRDYAMTKITYLSRVRAAELCWVKPHGS